GIANRILLRILAHDGTPQQTAYVQVSEDGILHVVPPEKSALSSALVRFEDSTGKIVDVIYFGGDLNNASEGMLRFIRALKFDALLVKAGERFLEKKEAWKIHEAFFSAAKILKADVVHDAPLGRDNTVPGILEGGNWVNVYDALTNGPEGTWVTRFGSTGP